MKATLLLVLLLALSSAAFAQYGNGATPLLNGPNWAPPSNPQHAGQHDMRGEQNLLGDNGYISAHGERPMWECTGHETEPSLGDVARAYRKDHEKMAKAAIVWKP